MKKRTTRRDIAELVGVSGTVVSDVLNQNPAARVSEETRQRVIEAARELNYRPHGIARRLVSGRTYNISFAIYDLVTIVHQSWSRIFLGISRAADAHKYTVDLATTAERQSSQGHFHYEKKIGENITEGFVLYDSVIAPERIRDTIIARGYPIVLVDRRIPGLEVPSVCNAYGQSMTQIVDYIRDLGHRRWGFVHFANLDDRFYNYVQMKEALETLWRLEADDRPMPCLAVSHNEAVDIVPDLKTFLEQMPDVTCLICWTDGTAACVNRALAALKLRVPEDISLIGVNNEHYGSYLQPSLTSIEIQRELMGQYAAEMLFQQIEGQQLLVTDKLVDSRLEVRDSVGRAPSRH